MDQFDPAGEPRNHVEASRPTHSATAPWTDGIAIIGMSARFPQSRSVQEFWAHLLRGDSLIHTFSVDELRRGNVGETVLADPNYVRRGNTIDEGDCFDADFFGLSRREAEILDPQHRVFLECAWEALEDAGYTGDGQSVGVFAGAGMNTYVLQLLGNPEILANASAYQLMLASDKDYLATRVAYKLNLRGPAVAVQTACSTSLAAVHMACRSLLQGECSMALAGGVSISFPQGVGYSYIPGMILSPDGSCRPFDAQAKGTVPGRGAGVVVLKRLSEAIADGDSIIAVIRGSAWNNDGAAKVGYTAPSMDGQADVIRTALAAAGVYPGQVGYVETHGTATEMGDAIEFAALSQVFGDAKREHPLVLGAVKANMGHADAAAGVAGLIKAALAVNAGVIPPTPGFSQPNPALGLERTRFVISSSALEWTNDEQRWAGVSSFGIGGTNVHVVLSRGPAVSRLETTSARPQIFPVSARTTSALNRACERLSRSLTAEPSVPAADIAATLQLGRRSFGFRRAVVAGTGADAARLLLEPGKNRGDGPDLSRDVVFLFPGQGQQFPGMAETLYRGVPAFRATIDAGSAILQQHCALDVLPLIAGSERTPALTAALGETQIAQPCLFLVESALAEHWRSLGAEPAALVGHSLGELTAACVAGVFTFEDGLRLAAERGRLMAETSPGLMLAVMLPPEKLADRLDTGLWLAAENGSKVTVASGTVDAIEDLERRLEAERIAAMRLPSKNAFHTPLMAEAAKAFREIVAGVPRRAPAIPWLSNVSGFWIDPAEAQDPQYWANQIVSPVRFTRNLSVLAERRRLLLEVGPGKALTGIARQQMPGSETAASLDGEDRRVSDETVFLRAVAHAWECGVRIDWSRLRPGEKHRRVSLPTYPFERQRYWVDKASPNVETVPRVEAQRSAPSAKHGESYEKREDLSSWFYMPSWQSTPPARLALPAQRNDAECWLVLAGEDPVSRALVSALREQEVPVISVTAGKGFSWQNGTATVDPLDPEDLKRLWAAIDGSRFQPFGLIELWSLAEGALSGYDIVLRLLQAAGSRQRRLRRFEFITSALESVHGETIRHPERAELYGLARALPTELGGVECRCIDIETPDAGGDAPFRLLLEELSTRGSGISVAYRGDQRWQKGWTPLSLRESSESPFRTSGVYLITGGVGGIGYVVAKSLLRDHQARVVLTGRTSLPDRAEWASLIESHDGSDSVSLRIRRMQELEESGGEVLFVPGDVADRDSMRRVLSFAQQRFGTLHGVIHAAGVAGGSRLMSQSIEEAQKIRTPKTQGSRILAELLHGSKLDFLLFCSSISAAAPAPSQSAYAAANAFQNTFAEYCRSSLGLPAVAIDFDAWREVGMLAEAEVPPGMELYFDGALRRAMTNAEGIEVIRRVLGQWRGPQILTSTSVFSPPSATSLEDMADLPTAMVDAAAAFETDDLHAILEIWKELLGVESVDPADNFFSLGGHSLMGTMMIARIRDRMGVTLSLRHLFDASTPAELVAVVRSVRQEAVAQEAQPATDDGREVFEI